jgi:hypothetical protein
MDLLKCLATAGESPIRAARGRGYVFAASIVISDA